jgi:exodeoxyribonuclease V alpha subunit
MGYEDNSYPKFRRDENNLLEEDVIIIDETSMVDTLLMAALLKAIKPGSRLILIGDADQLPPVGAGNILNDLITSERFTTVILKEIFRQAEQSQIVTNAHAINNGKYPDMTVKDGDFFFISRGDDSEIAVTIVDLCLKRLPKKYGAEVINNIQIITPSHKGAAGTEQLNAVLQKTLNPPDVRKREKKVRDVVFREGDKIMQIKNDYDIEWEKDGKSGMGIFNGDIGIIMEINPGDETVRINFDERVAVYDFSLMDELEHAYAITVHKSQGSEYPIVIIPLYNHSPKLLTRNLLYTAVTRAQEMVILVGLSDVAQNMVDNNRQVKRYTGLEYFLKKLNDE